MKKQFRKDEKKLGTRPKQHEASSEGPITSFKASATFKAVLLRTDAVEVFQWARHSPTGEEIAKLSSIMFCGLRFVSLAGLIGCLSRILGACENDKAAVSAVLDCLDAVKDKSFFPEALAKLEECKSKASMVEMARAPH